MGVDALPLEPDLAFVRLANRAFYGLIWDEVKISPVSLCKNPPSTGPGEIRRVEPLPFTPVRVIPARKFPGKLSRKKDQKTQTGFEVCQIVILHHQELYAVPQ